MERIDELNEVLKQYSDEQGWNERSQVELLLSFLAHITETEPEVLGEHLAEFAQRERDAEEGDIDDDPEEEPQ